jgi:hypothetical protein
MFFGEQLSKRDSVEGRQEGGREKGMDGRRER